jgi:hypothetical protein
MAFQNRAILRLANNIKDKNTQDKNTQIGNDLKNSLEEYEFNEEMARITK